MKFKRNQPIPKNNNKAVLREGVDVSKSERSECPLYLVHDPDFLNYPNNIFNAVQGLRKKQTYFPLRTFTFDSFLSDTFGRKLQNVHAHHIRTETIISIIKIGRFDTLLHLACLERIKYTYSIPENKNSINFNFQTHQNSPFRFLIPTATNMC